MPPPPGLPPLPQTFSALLQAFTSFLTVSIHTILYHRSLYPRTSFLTARAYNYPVHQNRHPAVCAWIQDAVQAVHAELLQGSVARVCLVVYDGECRPLERFVWDVGRFPAVPRTERETPFASCAVADEEKGKKTRAEGDRKKEKEDRLRAHAGQPTTTTTTSKGKSGPEYGSADVDLEEQFRAALAKLSVCDAKLKPLPDGCTFTVAVELKDTADPPIGHPQPWIPVEPNLQATKQRQQAAGSGSGSDGGNGGGGESETRRGKDLGGVKTTPVRAVDAGEMAFEMWIEEGKAKMEIPSKEATSSAETG